jgi:hypothetical protein
MGDVRAVAVVEFFNSFRSVPEGAASFFGASMEMQINEKMEAAIAITLSYLKQSAQGRWFQVAAQPPAVTSM